uniref:Uncharacterized protein n=1 Tax=uncultured bacterium contig00053 TaxID=1181537 RepID=A0A806JY67_9BACT|nr:hypothetical protein [uncultured bacterium contig00053]
MKNIQNYFNFFKQEAVMKKKTIIMMAILAFVLSISFISCGLLDLVSEITDPESSETDPADSMTLAPALRAVTTASSNNANPIVMSSYTDGTYNYYLIDVGFIQNMYVSAIGFLHYNGMTPMSLSQSTISETTITNAMTETISDSITFSNTQSGKVGIQFAYEKSILFIRKFSVKLNGEWAGSWTNTTTSTRSRETSVSTAESYGRSESISFTVGEHGEPEGFYRYALYAVCDVYFVISTSLDNQELISWDTLACIRDNSYFPHMDYSTNGIFDNSPLGNEITFVEDFYKTLPRPSIGEQPPQLPPPWTGMTDWVTIRTETKKITDSGRFNQHFDTINFNKFNYETDGVPKPISLSELKELGYKTVSFYIRLDVIKFDAGWQYIFLFNSSIKSNDFNLGSVQFDEGGSLLFNYYRLVNESILKFENISIDKFMNDLSFNEFFIRYGASGDSSDDWGNMNLRIQLLFKK